MKHEIGSKEVLNFPGHPMHGQIFEVVRWNARPRFVIARATKRFGDYRKGDELRFTGTLLAALKPAP